LGLKALRPAALLLVLAALGGCASVSTERDGPHPHPPPHLERVPDAVPRLEPVRAGGPNKPYDVEGRRYVPLAQLAPDAPFTEHGLATWYGRKYHGRPTSSGEPYDMFAMTAAHPTLPIPSYARVRNPTNGRSVVVRINDRGPFVPGRVIDLSYTAALKLDALARPTPVVVERIRASEIQRGR
jgi:rare lipoprotein A